MTKLISDEYRKLNRQMLEECDGYAVMGDQNAQAVIDLMRSRPALASILDYGCGRQLLQKALPSYVIDGYDPCVPGLDAPPTPHDLVVCGDVLEHIEPELLDNVLDNLRFVTRRCGYYVICTKPAKKLLPDGSNPHRIVEDEAFWLPKLLNHGFHIDLYRKTATHLILVVT